MVLIIFADAGSSWMTGIPWARQCRSWPDTRKHEDLRRVIDAGAENDSVPGDLQFVAVFAVAHALDFVTVKNQRGHLGVADDVRLARARAGSR